MSSISTPPTHLTAGRPFDRSRWLASSSKPHWQRTSVAPASLHFWTISTKYIRSCSRSASNFSTESMSTLCLVLGFGGSNGQVRIAIRASSTLLGICGCEKSLSTTMPSTRRVSSRRPPTLPSTLIRSRLTSRRARSATASTALTHISAMSLLHLPTILEDSVVAQVATRGSMSLLLLEEASAPSLAALAAPSGDHANSTATRSSSAVAARHAASYPSAIFSG